MREMRCTFCSFSRKLGSSEFKAIICLMFNISYYTLLYFNFYIQVKSEKQPTCPVNDILYVQHTYITGTLVEHFKANNIVVAFRCKQGCFVLNFNSSFLYEVLCTSKGLVCRKAYLYDNEWSTLKCIRFSLNSKRCLPA